MGLRSKSSKSVAFLLPPELRGGVDQTVETYTATIATEVTEGRHSGGVTFSVAEGAAHDEAGNLSTRDERYMVIFVGQEDNERPYPRIIVPADGQGSPLEQSFEVTIEFSEFVSGFTQDDIDLRWTPIDGYNVPPTR